MLMSDQAWGWLALGFAGQALFSARFLVQWVSSERHKRSVIPLAFWYFSLAGGATLFAYAAAHRRSGVHSRSVCGRTDLQPQPVFHPQGAPPAGAG